MESSIIMPTRKRVSQACVPCGDKKVKCDGVHPVCGPCAHKRLNCTYGISRRKYVETPSNMRCTGGGGADAGHSKSSYRFDRAEYRSEGVGHPLSPRVGRGSALLHDRVRRPVPTPNSVHAEYSTRLFQAYFELIHPTWPILYKPFFNTLDFGNPTPKIALSLVYAIYAIVLSVETLTEDGFATEQKQGRDLSHHHMSQDAVNALYNQSGKPGSPFTITPSIEHCQTLAILALQQHNIAQFASAASLCSQACTMALELNLHRPDSSIGAAETEVRNRLWWSVYVLDKVVAREMNRPCLLRHEDTDVAFPSVSESDEFDLMPFIHDHEGSSMQMPAKMHTVSGFHSTITLAMLGEKIARQIYSITSRKRLRQNPLVAEETRLAIWNDLQAWEQNIEQTQLKLDLASDHVPIPAALAGYLLLWTLTILVHRPFIPTARSHPDAPIISEAVHPHRLCYDAASKLCYILEQHADRCVGLASEMVFSIFLSASIFLHDLQNVHPENTDARERLIVCVRWLDVYGKGWRTSQHQAATLAAAPVASMISQQVDSTTNTPTQRDSQDRSSLLDDTRTMSTPGNLAEGALLHNHHAPMTPQMASQLQHAASSNAPPLDPLGISGVQSGNASPADPNGATPVALPYLDLRIPDWGYLDAFGDPHDAELFWELDGGVRELVDERKRDAVLKWSSANDRRASSNA